MSELKIQFTTPELDRAATALEDIAEAIIDPRFRAQPRIKFTKIQIDPYIQLGGDLMAITITDSQQFDLAAQGVDKKGKPTSLDGAIAFTSSDPAILTVTPLTDTSATVVAVGELGVAQITATGDADLGAGVVAVLGVLDVTVVAGPAVNIAINPGVPTEQP